MQTPLIYASDCIRLVGYIIDHIPLSSIDFYQMGKSYDNRNDIWKEEFNYDTTTDHLYSLPRPTIQSTSSKMEEVD